MATILFYGLVFYVVIGIVTAIAFVTVGVARVFPHMTATVPARMLWLPGAAIMWPYVLMRWRKVRAAA
jgi:hypothetical protein